MTDPFEEHGDRLRRVLRAEADEIMPNADGLERIRARTSKGEGLGRWAWFTASWTRPLVAVGGAVLVAVVAVSAPPTINHITSLSGDQGSTAHHTTSDKPGETAPTAGPSYPVNPDGEPSEQGGVPPTPWASTPVQPSGCPSGRGPQQPVNPTDRKVPTTRRTDRTTAKPTCPPTSPTTPSTPSTHPSSASPSSSSSPPPSQGSAAPGQGGQP